MRYSVKEQIGGYHSTCFGIWDNKIEKNVAITFTRPDATMIVKRLNESMISRDIDQLQEKIAAREKQIEMERGWRFDTEAKLKQAVELLGKLSEKYNLIIHSDGLSRKILIFLNSEQVKKLED